MRKIILLSVLLVAIIFISGCVESTPTGNVIVDTEMVQEKEETVKESTLSAEAYTLKKTDLSEVYVLRSEEKLAEEQVGPITIETYGVKDNYNIIYSTSEDKKYIYGNETLDWDEIEQTIYIMSERENAYKYFENRKKHLEENVFYTLKEVEEDTNIDTSFHKTYTYKMGSPEVGNNSMAYKKDETIYKYTDYVYTIEFVKNDVYVKMSIIGTNDNYKLLEQMAKKTADKIV